MGYANPQSLVSTEWLAQHLNAPDVRVVDASWYMKHLGRDPKAEFKAEHIPGAVYFDIDDIADTDSDLPHMMPSAEKFSSRCRRLGLGDGVRIVIYDGGGCTAAARAWWMFRAFGHDDVSVLDGGLPKWKAENRPLADLPDVPRERHLSARYNTFLVRDVDQVLDNVKRNREQVLDARSAGRFAGTDPEPREGLRSGHIPNSLNLPYQEMFKADGTFKDATGLQAAFDRAGIDMKKPVVTTCGSGVTACVLALGLHLIGHRQTAVYDGSWTEWGGRDDLPISR
ncbi:3-mercaptopyruvate sulfurtransferase [Minwuia sp.]|uniref:3-mercaptopyruvate sulfurtransferase n=1 Tax=Minwuia sp. TaxID=2493630 RepID=UPI003A9520E6